MVKNRKCTDICFIFVISIAAILMVAFGAFGWMKGSFISLYAPFDSDGKFCGVVDGKKTETYKYLYYPTLGMNGTLYNTFNKTKEFSVCVN